MSGPENCSDFAYGQVHDAGGLSMTVSIFADRPHLREELREDIGAAGLHVRECGPVAELLAGKPRSLGEVIFLDCPSLDAASLAALSRLDMRAAHSGAHLVISTSVDALDDVFGCCDQSNPQILVDPSRSERVIALGRVLALRPNLRLRELNEEDRLTLLRLTEQVGRIAERLEKLHADRKAHGGSAFRLESPGNGYHGETAHGDRLVRSARLELPEPRLVREIIRHRQLRAKFFDGDLFADPAWDILLDLTAARAEHARVSVTSLCIASGVPPTTALRWIGQMTSAGLLKRVEDPADRRRAFIALTDQAAEAMAGYFAETGVRSAELV
ncbi:hypothetical protein FHS61_000111 [Altererythrobacter atlanticus]|uniref:HTH marR-type domain-containing protein n=1 Tax=Croceibacterium atlanticum TaxID=1267766 RepID=A0A0F7KT51_9SPHN|nr:winged helix DNA-binding protein [Croceibacterium atlanticum]AKH42341.1 hypothetical protein WYH_01297 [Croceibacterium atlanticum]MBB5731118.1 hypothetical protein [Croceibacterium atlanticum]